MLDAHRKSWFGKVSGGATESWLKVSRAELLEEKGRGKEFRKKNPTKAAFHEKKQSY